MSSVELVGVLSLQDIIIRIRTEKMSAMYFLMTIDLGLFIISGFQEFKEILKIIKELIRELKGTVLFFRSRHSCTCLPRHKLQQESRFPPSFPRKQESRPY